MQDLSEGVLDLFRNKKNPDLGAKRRAEVEFFLTFLFCYALP